MAAEQPRTPEQIAEAEITKFKGLAVKDGDVIENASDNMTQAERDHAQHEAEVAARLAPLAKDADGKTAANRAAEAAAAKPKPKTAPEIAKAALAAARGETLEEPDETVAEPVDAETPESEEGTETPEPEEGAKKSGRKPTAEDRIADLTGKWRRSERALEETNKALDEMRQLLVNNQAGRVTMQGAQPTQQIPVQPQQINRDSPDYIPQSFTLKKPEPKDFEYEQFDPKYAVALANWETRRVLAADNETRTQQQFTAAQRQEIATVTGKIKEIVDEGVDKYPDLPKVIAAGQRGEWPLSRFLGEKILASPHAADIAYALGTDLDESARVAGLSEAGQRAWFERMEAHFEGADPSPPAQKPVKVSKAPTPVKTPVGRHGGTPAAVRADTSDFQAFERMAMAKR